MNKKMLYWVKRLELQIGLFLGISILYSIILYNNHADNFRQKMLEGTLFYSIIFGTITVMIFQTTNLIAILPMAIGFGATRKEAAREMQVLPLGATAQYVLFYSLFSLLAYGVSGFDMRLAVLYLGILLFCSGMGQLLNCLHVVSGGKTGIYIVILIVSIMISVSVASLFMVPGMMGEAFQYTFRNGFILTVSIAMRIAIVAGGCLYAISFYVFNRVLKKYEVKY